MGQILSKPARLHVQRMRYTKETTPVTTVSAATCQAVSKERVAVCPQG
jgi:hypothetical protein